MLLRKPKNIQPTLGKVAILKGQSPRPCQGDHEGQSTLFITLSHYLPFPCDGIAQV